MNFIIIYLAISLIILGVVMWYSDFVEKVNVNNFMDILAAIVVSVKFLVLWPIYFGYGIVKGIKDQLNEN